MNPETTRTSLQPKRGEATSSLWGLFLDVFYPPRCGGCDLRGTLLCDRCRASINRPENPFLLAPGLFVTAAGKFGGPLREAIHKLKFEGDTPLAKPLAAMLADALSEAFADGLPDGTVLVPVPLHASRQRARGFNQSELLARELSRLSQLPVDRSLIRHRDTGTQVGRTASERRESVEGAFRWTSANCPRSVLLIDDVCTTGATLVSCSHALRDAGATTVHAATVARAVFEGEPND